MKWSKDEMQAMAQYRKDVIAKPFQIQIAQQRYIIESKQETINKLNNLITSEMKSHVKNVIAYRLSENIFKYIEKAIIESGLNNPNNIVEIKCRASDLRFKTPNEVENIILTYYKNHFTKEMSFSIRNSLVETKITYEIHIPKLTICYTQ